MSAGPTTEPAPRPPHWPRNDRSPGESFDASSSASPALPRDHTVWTLTPWPKFAAWVVGGTTAGLLLAWPGVWLAVAAAGMVVRGRMGRSAARAVILTALVAATAASRSGYLPADSIEPYLTADGQLARVEGVVVTPPRLTAPSEGFFAGFAYEAPRTLLTLEVERLSRGMGPLTEASGRVLVKINEAHTELALGDRVALLGWLGDVGLTKNPGEFNYRDWLAERGVRGRLSVRVIEHVQRLDSAEQRAGGSLVRWSQSVGDALARTLAEGMQGDEEDGSAASGPTEFAVRLALLETLLLGRGEGGLGDLRESFRRVGLAHVLSISGAHFGILVLLAWAVAKAASANPRRVAWLVLLAVLAYAAVLPGRVPIVRATIMAVAYFGPAALGRAIPGRDALCLAAAVILLWQPEQLFSSGFQLSFLAVAAILLYTATVADWLWPQPLVPLRHVPAWMPVARAVVNYLAVSIVAFCAVLPLIVFHFGMVSPWAILLSLLSWPVLFGVLALGYLKMLVGWLLPSAGLLLAGPLGWAVDVLVSLAERAERWPGATWQLARPMDHPLGVLWTLAALAWVAALLGGRFRWRRRLGVALAAGLGLMLMLTQGVHERLWRGPAASLSMVAVGDGSCFVLQSRGQTLVFDCGSQGYDRVGERSAVPALRSLGVRHIDVLALSHADLDHFSGVPEVLEAFPVRRVICSPEVFAEAQQRPTAATAYLLDWLAQRQQTPEPVLAGWTLALGEAQLEALWPPPELVAEGSNDHSLLLRIAVAGRTALLHGDLQPDPRKAQHAELLGKLAADVTDLPHHGSFRDDDSAAWLAAVAPAIALHSSGPDRLRFDRWTEPLREAGTRRYTSHHHGLTTVDFHADGTLSARTFLSPIE